MLIEKTKVSSNPPALSRDSLLAKMRSEGLSHRKTLEESAIVLLGPYKAGKTFCAVSISDLYPEELPSETIVELTDTYLLDFDTGATDGLLEQGITVPSPHDLHLNRMEDSLSTYLKKVYRGSESAIARVAEYSRAGIVRNLIIDTVSTFDWHLTSYLSKKYEAASDNDKKGMWSELSQYHHEFYQACVSTGCRVVFICHVKEIFEIISKNDGGKSEQKAKNRRLVSMLPGKADIQAQVTGKSAGIYKGQGSLILPVIKSFVGGKAEYNIYTKTTKGIEGGSRFLKGLEDKEPAHLGKLLRKIRANQPKEVEIEKS